MEEGSKDWCTSLGGDAPGAGMLHVESICYGLIESLFFAGEGLLC
jgi:hypothetical protein